MDTPGYEDRTSIMAERLNTMMHGDLKRALLRFSTDGRASKTDE